MRRITRSMLWGGLLSVLILLGLAAYAYFVGTRTVLEHAEAFDFRRLSVSQVADSNQFRFFYATNRQRGTGAESAESLELRFTATQEPELKFGYFDTEFETSLGLGILINPSDWLLNEEIHLHQVDALALAEFVEQLRSQVEASPRHSLLIAVHGFREAFPSALRKTAFLSHVLDIDTPVLLFDWPGNQGSSLRGYRRARRVAEASGAELAALLKLAVDQVQPQRLWLLANSMGAQVVVDAFNLLAQQDAFADATTEIKQVVLTAPDVDHRDFNQQFKQQITALADTVTVYVSSNDRALVLSRLINRGTRLGESTLDPRNPEQLDETAALLELLEVDDRHLVLVDVTPVNRTRNFHSFSLETPEFFDDLFLRLTGDTLPESRDLHYVTTQEGSRYYIITRGR